MKKIFTLFLVLVLLSVPLTIQGWSNNYSRDDQQSDDRFFENSKQVGVYLGEKQSVKAGYQQDNKESYQHIFIGLAVLLCLGFMVLTIRKRKKQKHDEEGSYPKPPVPKREAEWTIENKIYMTIPLNFIAQFEAILPTNFLQYVSSKIQFTEILPYAMGYFSYLISVFIIKLTPHQSSAIMIGCFLFGMLFCYLRESLLSRYLLPIVSMLYEIISKFKVQWIILLVISIWIHTPSIILYFGFTMFCLSAFRIYVDAKMTLSLSEKYGIYLQWQDKKVLEFIFASSYPNANYKSLKELIADYRRTVEFHSNK